MTRSTPGRATPPRAARLPLLAAFAAAAAITSAPVAAQSLWLPRDTVPLVRIEALRPDLEGTAFDGLSSAWFITGQWRFNDAMWAVVEVPLAYGERDHVFGRADDLDPGNPYLGARWLDESGSFVDFGVRLPLGEVGRGAFIGYLAEPERPGAFGQDVVTLRARGGRGAAVADGVILEPSVGFAWLMGNGGTGAYGLYGAVLRGEPEPLFWSAGITGRLLVNGAGDLGRDSFHHAAATLGRRFDRFAAALTLQAPVAEEFAVDWVAGVALQMVVR